MKAIETEYGLHNFRSRLEARWAVFFDALGVEWEYEKEGYDLDDGTRYLPDFWLPKLKVFVEVKGEEPNKEECLKAMWLREGTGYPLYFVFGKMENCAHVFQVCPNCKAINMIEQSMLIKGNLFKTQWRPIGTFCGHSDNVLQLAQAISLIRPVVRIATSARFEFGETPKRTLIPS